MAQTGDFWSPSTDGGYVLCAEVQISFIDFCSQKNINRLKLRHTGR